jgi:hypothetical protein
MPEDLHTPTWKDLLAEDMQRALAALPWSRVMFGMAWVHLGFFLVCQALYASRVEGDLRFPALWVLEMIVLLGVMRAVGGPGWAKRCPAQGLVLRVWITMMILSFNVATLNSLTGWSMDWFKLVWATLGTFLFATLAWLFTLRFLVLAVQMYFTGLLMVKFPDHNYLIFGLSWWLALHAVGIVLWRHERARQAQSVEAVRPTVSRRRTSTEPRPRPSIGGEPALVGLE